MSYVIRTLFKYSLLSLTYIFCGFIAWFATSALYSNWTQEGNVYSESLKPVNTQYERALVVLEGDEEYYMRRWRDDHSVAEYDIYIGGFIAVTISVGNIENIQQYVKEEYFSECTLNKKLGYAIFWQFSGTATRNLRNLYGLAETTGCRVLVGYTDESNWTPNARNVDLDIPKGGLSPLMTLLLNRGMEGLNTSADTKVIKAMNIRMVSEISTRLRLDELNRAIEKIAFLYGPIQFYTIFLLFFCITILILSFKVPWARAVTEGMLDLIPYVGFFGTLMGMGAALSILGDANLSDPISKAINLGPIGSKLSLAIETTKFALVCFGVGTLFILFRDTLKHKKGEDKVKRIINV